MYESNIISSHDYSLRNKQPSAVFLLPLCVRFAFEIPPFQPWLFQVRLDEKEIVETDHPLTLKEVCGAKSLGKLWTEKKSFLQSL